MPEQLTPEHEDIIDEALQVIANWCDISGDVEAHGLRACRQAKRSITAELESLAQVSFLVLGGQRQAALAAVPSSVRSWRCRSSDRMSSISYASPVLQPS